MTNKELIDKIQELYTSKNYEKIIDFYSKSECNSDNILSLIQTTKEWKDIDTNVELILFQAILFSVNILLK